MGNSMAKKQIDLKGFEAKIAGKVSLSQKSLIDKLAFRTCDYCALKYPKRKKQITAFHGAHKYWFCCSDHKAKQKARWKLEAQLDQDLKSGDLEAELNKSDEDESESD